MLVKVSTLCLALLLCVTPLLSPPAARAADHPDAPAVDGAGEGDLTGVFAFLDPNDKTHLVLIMGVNPFALPVFTQSYRFSPDYLYQFKIDVNGDAKEDLVIQVRFRNTASGQNILVHTDTPDPIYVGAVNRWIDNARSQVEFPTETTFGVPHAIM